MPKLKKFTGINNVDAPVDAGAGDLQTAVNVLIDDKGAVHRRPGFSVLDNGTVHSLDSSSGNLLCVIDDDLCRYADPTPAVLLADLTAGHPVAYLTLNGRTYFCNGHESGVLVSGVVRTWGLTAPNQPSVTPIKGNMTPGEYQVAIAYVRADGQESAPCTPQVCNATEGGIRVFGCTASTDASVTGIAVYVSGLGGEVLPTGEGLYRYIIMPNADTSEARIVDFGSTGTGAPCSTLNTYPPPIGTGLAFYRGRVYIVDSNILWYTKPWMYEHLDTEFGFLPFQSTITNVLPVENGIWVTTTTETMFLFGKDPASDGGFEVRARTQHAGLLGGRIVDGATLSLRGALPGMTAVWVGDNGVHAGDGNGVLFPLTSGRWEPTGTTGVFGCIDNTRGSSQYLFGIDSSVFAMNLATKAVCEVGYPFASMAELSGDLYGSGTAGLCALDADTDDGTAIDSEIEKQGIDFGSQVVKRITEMYAHVKCTGSLLFTISSDVGSGAAATPVRAADYARAHKVHTPRGVSGRNFTINVQNVDGADFVLYELDASTAASPRNAR